MSVTVIPASQAHFRVLDYMGGDSTITDFAFFFFKAAVLAMYSSPVVAVK